MTETTAMRVMAEQKAVVVMLVLVAEMMMARVVVARMVMEMGIAENQMRWSGGQ
jgi:hypothetical protein